MKMRTALPLLLFVAGHALAAGLAASAAQPPLAAAGGPANAPGDDPGAQADAIDSLLALLGAASNLSSSLSAGALQGGGGGGGAGAQPASGSSGGDSGGGGGGGGGGKTNGTAPDWRAALQQLAQERPEHAGFSRLALLALPGDQQGPPPPPLALLVPTDAALASHLLAASAGGCKADALLFCIQGGLPPSVAAALACAPGAAAANCTAPAAVVSAAGRRRRLLQGPPPGGAAAPAAAAAGGAAQDGFAQVGAAQSLVLSLAGRSPLKLRELLLRHVLPVDQPLLAPAGAPQAAARPPPSLLQNALGEYLEVWAPPAAAGPRQQQGAGGPAPPAGPPPAAAVIGGGDGGGGGGVQVLWGPRVMGGVAMVGVGGVLKEGASAAVDAAAAAALRRAFGLSAEDEEAVGDEVDALAENLLRARRLDAAPSAAAAGPGAAEAAAALSGCAAAAAAAPAGAAAAAAQPEAPGGAAAAAAQPEAPAGAAAAAAQPEAPGGAAAAAAQPAAPGRNASREAAPAGAPGGACRWPRPLPGIGDLTQSLQPPQASPQLAPAPAAPAAAPAAAAAAPQALAPNASGPAAAGRGRRLAAAARALRQSGPSGQPQPPAAASTNTSLAGAAAAAGRAPDTPATPQAQAAAVPEVDGDAVAFLTVFQLSEMLRNGSATARGLARAFGARLRRFNPALRAVVTYTDALSEAAAARADELLSQRAARAKGASPLLLGIPYGIKDIFAVPGYPSTWGCAALAGRAIDQPSWAFEALSGGAGAVHLAKLSTGELAWGDSWFGGTTANPWDPSTGSCGSSAGSAAAVAAGLVPLALGSETWGSILCPAATTGATAFRPTGGSIPQLGVLQVSASLDKTGVFCRQALDCAAAARALAPPSPPPAPPAAPGAFASPGAGPTQASRPPLFATAARFRELLSNESRDAGAGGLCIGFLNGTDPGLVSVLNRTASRCMAGPLPDPPGFDVTEDVLSAILQSEVAVSFEGIAAAGLILPNASWASIIRRGEALPAAVYLKAQRLRQLLREQVSHYFAAHRISALAKPAGRGAGPDGLASLLGLPEVSLPVGFTNDTGGAAAPGSGAAGGQGGGGGSGGGGGGSGGGGSGGGSGGAGRVLPVVNTLFGPAGGDAAVVLAADAFQSATDYHLRRPTVLLM